MTDAQADGSGSPGAGHRRRRGRLPELATLLGGIDPGLARLRLAWIAVASMLLAVGATEILRITFAPGEPATVLLFAGVLAMVANIAVNEPDLRRRRVSTALMLPPAAASTVVGSLLSPYRIVAAAVFVAIMVAAVWVRRYGSRGFALGMAAFMPYFFTQFLQTRPAQVPWLLVAVTCGLGATFLVRGVVFAERPERTLRRLVAAFRARAHALLDTVDDVLAGLDPATAADLDDDARAAVVERMRRARLRLNETALLVEDQLEQVTAGRVWPGLGNDVLALRVFDAELALERLSVAVRRLADAVAEGADASPSAAAVAALRAGVDRLAAALAGERRHAGILTDVADARAAVAGLVADTRAGRERAQRAAFAVRRVADAIEHAQRDAPARRSTAAGEDVVTHGGVATGAPPSARPDHDDARDLRSRDGDGEEAGDREGRDTDHPDERPGLALTTRQAVQVGVATSLAIVGGELLAPSRSAWAVVAAFVVFANTTSRGDLLSRSWGRVAGTVGGVAAGMGLGALVGGNTVWTLVLLFVCVFLAVYLVRISPSLLAFWITAVLALVYGLLGQFSVQVLVLRIEETVVGVVASVLAAFLVLPQGTRAAFGTAVDEFVDAADDVLAGAVDQLEGRHPTTPPISRAREMDDALALLRQRSRPLEPPAFLGPRRRGRSSRRRGVRVLGGVDHYARALARLSGDVAEPSWAPTLRPAAEQVRANLDALRDVLVRGRRRSDGEQVLARSAETVVDAAEEHVARIRDPHRRADLLAAARLLRRVDQAVVALAVDLGAADDTETAQPSRDSRARLTKTPSGS